MRQETLLDCYRKSPIVSLIAVVRCTRKPLELFFPGHTLFTPQICGHDVFINGEIARLARGPSTYDEDHGFGGWIRAYM